MGVSGNIRRDARWTGEVLYWVPGGGEGSVGGVESFSESSDDLFELGYDSFCSENLRDVDEMENDGPKKLLDVTEVVLASL